MRALPRSSAPRVDRATFTVGPLCRWVMPLSDFAAWLDDAKPGDRTVYATGQALPPGSATVVLAREAHAGGLIDLNFKAETDEAGARVQNYLATRKASAKVAALMAARGVSTSLDTNGIGRAGAAESDDALFEAMDAVLVRLKRAANLGLVCPTNSEIARAIALPDASGSGKERVRYLITKLIKAGDIKVADQGPRARRIVTIRATGKTTVEGAL